MILVTGATGFLGSHIVCELLQRGKIVRGLSRNNASLREFDLIFSVRFKSKTTHEQQTIKQNLHWLEADVLDLPALQQAMQGIDEVYHCAAIVSFHQKHRQQMMKINVQGTANVVNLALLNRVKKFCHISSIAALGRTKSSEQIDETALWDNNSTDNSNYAISKHKAELEVWRGVEEGLNAVIVNPGVLIGTGDWGKGSLGIFKAVDKGLKFYSEGINGYVDAEDVAKASVELMERNSFAERFVLVAENLSMGILLNLIADTLHKPRPSIKVNRFLAELAWMAFAVKRLLAGDGGFQLTKETARASTKKYFYNSQKIKATIGFKFKTVKQTVELTCKNQRN